MNREGCSRHMDAVAVRFRRENLNSETGGVVREAGDLASRFVKGRVVEGAAPTERVAVPVALRRVHEDRPMATADRGIDGVDEDAVLAELRVLADSLASLDDVRRRKTGRYDDRLQASGELEW